MAKVLLVDDDAQALESTKKILELSGHEVMTAVDGHYALDRLRPVSNQHAAKFDVVVSDVRMPRLGGLDFLKALSLCSDKTPVVLMTAYGRVEDAVWAMKLGAVDFLTKPFKKHALLSSIDAALKRVKAEERIGNMHAALDGSLIGQSKPMQQLRALMQQVAPTVATVLISGESGTGKELVARCIHSGSARLGEKFIALNCAAVPENLIESELFGFEKGAFTGASAVKPGLFEAANGGTLLLDEIGDMPLVLQGKLLRVLQEGEVRRLGATRSQKVDVRVIAATNRNLKESVKLGQFRADLLYRLEVIEIKVPPLRDRMDDVPELARYFLLKSCDRHQKSIVSISEETMRILMAHSWPGNVRELSNIIERAVVFCNSQEICISDLPSHLVELGGDAMPGASARGVRGQDFSTIEVPIGAPLKQVEELLIRKTLEATEGDKNMTARLLGINSRTIYRKLDKLVEKEIDSE